MLTKTIKTKGAFLWLVFIQWVIAFEWIKSSWGKFAEPDFMNNISKTLGAFSSPGNPNEWYASFVRERLLPNANLFGNVTRFSELLAGLALALGGAWLLTQRNLRKPVALVVLIALVGGALLNFNFYFAAGWTSPSAEGINLVMGLVQLVLAGYYLRTLQNWD